MIGIGGIYMATPNKERARQLKMQTMQENPDAVSGKRIAGIIVLIFLLTRVLSIGIEIVCAVKGYTSPSVGIYCVTLLISLLFARLIYDGFKVFAGLAIVGGIFMVIQTFQNSLYTVIFSSEYYPIIRVYAFIYVFSSFFQLAGMLFLFFYKKTNAYFHACSSAGKQYMEEMKQPKL